jgi:hypothetical protein
MTKPIIAKILAAFRLAGAFTPQERTMLCETMRSNSTGSSAKEIADTEGANVLIIRLNPPTNFKASLFSGEAISKRGRKYRFCADLEGASCVFREEVAGRWWKQIAAPAALSTVAREAVRKAMQ